MAALPRGSREIQSQELWAVGSRALALISGARGRLLRVAVRGAFPPSLPPSVSIPSLLAPYERNTVPIPPYIPSLMLLGRAKTVPSCQDCLPVDGVLGGSCENSMVRPACWHPARPSPHHRQCPQLNSPIARPTPARVLPSALRSDNCNCVNRHDHPASRGITSGSPRFQDHAHRLGYALRRTIGQLLSPIHPLAGEIGFCGRS